MRPQMIYFQRNQAALHEECDIHVQVISSDSEQDPDLFQEGSQKSKAGASFKTSCALTLRVFITAASIRSHAGSKITVTLCTIFVL